MNYRPILPATLTFFSRSCFRFSRPRSCAGVGGLPRGWVAGGQGCGHCGSRGDRSTVIETPVPYAVPFLPRICVLSLYQLCSPCHRNPILVLNCCSAGSRGGRRVHIIVSRLSSSIKLIWSLNCFGYNFFFFLLNYFFGWPLVWICMLQRFGNMAGVFTVMACAVRAMDTKDVDEIFMMSLAKSATSEIITSKVCLILCSSCFVFQLPLKCNVE